MIIKEKVDYLSSYKQFCVRWYNENRVVSLHLTYIIFVFGIVYINLCNEKIKLFLFFLEKRKNRYYRIFLYKWSIVDLKNIKVIYLTSKIIIYLSLSD